MNNLPKKLISTCLFLLAGNACLGVGMEAGEKVLFRPDDWVAASNDHLEKMRGGFDAGSGLTVSFGIVRTVTINGELISKTSFNLPDVTKITSEQANMASSAMAGSGIVQNGPGNFVGSNVQSQLATGTLIQNSFNDQKIQAFTIINAGVNSLNIFKAINTQTLLKDALLGSMAVR